MPVPRPAWPVARSLRLRLTLGVAGLLLPLVAVAATALVALRRDADAEASLVHEAQNELLPLARMEAEVRRLRGEAPRTISTRRPVDVAELRRGADRLDGDFASMAAQLDEADEAALLVQAEQAWQRADEGITRRLDSTEDAPAEIDAYGNDLSLAAERLRLLQAAARQEMASEIAATSASRDRTERAVVGVCIASLVAAMLAGRRLARGVLLPVGLLREGARRLGEGDLSHRVGLERADELGSLGAAFDSMAEEVERGQRALRHSALHDPLTGLGNRTLLIERVDEALGGSDGTTLLLLDLDEFKTVNDSFGHPAGDRVLVAVAERIEARLGTNGTAARLGGDEFGVVLRSGDRGEGAALAARLLQLLTVPFQVEGTEVLLSGSVGLAIATAQDGAEELLRNADLAMYTAKRAGKGRTACFEPAMHAKAVERVALEADLRRGIERDELVLHYQPIVDLRTGVISGAEALVRWRSPERGLVPPLDFIPLAEETGLVVPIGAWVLDTACRQGAAWQRVADGRPFPMSVNVSARQLQHPEVVDHVALALARSGMDPSSLTLEITESVMMLDVEATLVRLHQLKALGVRLAIDDFGTGYSSLGYLQRFPIDRLKVDKSFVDGIPGALGSAVLAEAVVGLASSLRMEAVAEGIEREDQVGPLLRLGCLRGQGFLFSRPVEAVEMARMLALGAPLLAPGMAAGRPAGEPGRTRFPLQATAEALIGLARVRGE